MPTSAFGNTSLGGGSRATATAHGCAVSGAPIGATLFFHACWPDGTITPSSLVDNTAAHTWTFLSVADTGNAMRCMLGYAKLVAVPTTVTLTLSATAPLAWTSSRYAGGHGGYLFRSHLAATSAQTGAAVTSINGSLSAPAMLAHRLYVQTVGNDVDSTGITPTAGWTEIDDQGNTTATVRVDSSFRIASNSSTQAYGGSGPSASWGACIYAFDTSEIVEQPRGPQQDYRQMPYIQKAIR